MPDKLTPPVRYRNNGDSQLPEKNKRTSAQRKRIKRTQQTGSAQGEATVLRPQRGFKRLNNTDIFIRGGMDIPLFCTHRCYFVNRACYAVFGVISLLLF